MSADPAPLPSLRRRALPLGAYWLLLMGPFGLMLPFYGLYLGENAGLSGSELGAVFAVSPLVGIAVQPFWGLVADRTGMRARVLVVLGLGAALGYVAIGRAEGFAQILAATALLAVFTRSLIPMTLSVSLPSLEDHRHAFGVVRALGTVGFLATLTGFPLLLAQRTEGPRGAAAAAMGGPSEPALGLLFPLAAALSVAAALTVLAVPNRGAVALSARRGEWRVLLHHRAFLRVLAFTGVAFLFQNGPLEIFPVFVRARGGDVETVRSMWMVMLLPEILLMLGLGAARARLGARALLAIGLAAGGLRWLLCGIVTSLEWLLPVQALHAVVVMGLHLGAPLYVDQVVPPQLRSTAQAMLGVVAIGFGGAGSSLVSGWLLEHAGPEAPFLAGGIGSLALLALLPWGIPAGSDAKRR